MLAFVIICSLIVTITINVLTSCYVCYNVAIDPDQPVSTVATVSAIIIINALVPYVLGCITGLWYIM